jgi:hypothetical protein
MFPKPKSEIKMADLTQKMTEDLEKNLGSGSFYDDSLKDLMVWQQEASFKDTKKTRHTSKINNSLKRSLSSKTL